MLTDKATKEIEQIRKAIKSLENDLSLVNTSMVNANYITLKALQKERNVIWHRMYKKDEKIRQIEKIEISTSEFNQVKKESMESKNFVTIGIDRSLGMKGYIKIGWSKTLQSFIQVDLTYYTGFMSNVKGMRSLAGKLELNCVKRITEEEANELINKGCKHEENFINHSEKITPLNVTAAHLRNPL